jgi:hypothetical protein
LRQKTGEEEMSLETENLSESWADLRSRPVWRRQKRLESCGDRKQVVLRGKGR